MFTLLLDFGKHAGNAIKAAKARADQLGSAASVDAVAAVVLTETRDWEPLHQGQRVLTPAIRASLAKSFAMLAISISNAERAKLGKAA